MIGVFVLEVLIVDNTISVSNVAGAIVAVLLWWGVLRYIRRPEITLAIFVFITLAMAGLAPFVTRLDPIPFNWLPFHGYLGGSMYLNTQSAAEKVFFYGSLVYLLWRTGLNRFGSMLMSFTFILIIEFAQTRFIAHTPEITDPLLLIFAALTLMALEKHELARASGGREDTSRAINPPLVPAESNFSPDTRREKWINQTIHLRGDQFDFLVRLSQEMGISISRVTRHIIAEFMEGLRESDEMSDDHLS
jgi:hypothetical protein